MANNQTTKMADSSMAFSEGKDSPRVGMKSKMPVRMGRTDKGMGVDTDTMPQMRINEMPDPSRMGAGTHAEMCAKSKQNQQSTRDLMLSRGGLGKLGVIMQAQRG